MKKSHWITIFIIILFIAVIGICIYLSIDEEKAEPAQNDLGNRLDQTRKKIKGLESRIKEETAQLKLSKEMEDALSRKVDRICMVIGSVFALMVVGVGMLFYYNGFDLLTSILTTAGLFSLSFPLLSLILWRTITFDSVILITRAWIKKWLFKKYGYDPDAVTVLKDTQQSSQEQVDTLVKSIPSN